MPAVYRIGAYLCDPLCGIPPPQTGSIFGQPLPDDRRYAEWSSPAAAGSQPGNALSPSACSIAGSSRLHTEAAVITPAAKPSITRWMVWEFFLRNKKTTAAPAAVIRAVKPVPAAAQVSACNTMYEPFLKDSQVRTCTVASRLGYAPG